MKTQTYKYQGTTKKGLDVTVDVFFLLGDEIMINATEMAKPFIKKPESWLRTLRAKEIIDSLISSQKCELADLVYVKNASPENGGGTWMHRKVALHFALFLDVNFQIWVGDKIEELIREGSTTLSPDERETLTKSTFTEALLERKKPTWVLKSVFDNPDMTPYDGIKAFENYVLSTSNIPLEDLERTIDSIKYTLKEHKGWTLDKINEDLNFRTFKKDLLKLVNLRNGSTQKSEKKAFDVHIKKKMDAQIDYIKKLEKTVEAKDLEISEIKSEQVNLKSLQNMLENQRAKFNSDFDVVLKWLGDSDIAPLHDTINKQRETIKKAKVALDQRDKVIEMQREELANQAIDYEMLNKIDVEINSYHFFEWIHGHRYNKGEDKSKMAAINKRVSIIEEEQGLQNEFFESRTGFRHRKYRLGVTLKALYLFGLKQRLNS